LDRDLPADHLARRIARLVATLDLHALLDSYAGCGSAAWPPVLVLRLALYEIHSGRLSPAQWARDLRESGPVQWLTFGARPARSCLYAFRDRLGPLVDELNRQLLAQAQAEGYTTAARATLDGTFVAAYGSRHRLLNREALAQRLQQLHAAPAAAGPPPAWLARTAVGRQRQAARYAQAETRLTELQRQHGRTQKGKAQRHRRPAARVVVCPSEPAAALGRDKAKVFRPLYDVQLVADLDSPFVLGYGVYACVSDAGLLGPALERVAALTGRWPREVVADSIYASALDLAWCQDHQVVLYAPVPADATADAPPRGQLAKSQFLWLPAEQAYRCPEGHLPPLDRVGTEKRQGGQELVVLQYRCPPAHCLGCPRQARCTRSPQRGRTVKRSAHEPLVEALRARMATAEGKALYRRRKAVAEREFADLKAHRGLQRFRSYGPARAATQVGLVVLAHNGLQLLRARDQRASEAAKPHPPPG
jgi:transposase